MENKQFCIETIQEYGPKEGHQLGETVAIIMIVVVVFDAFHY